MRLSSVAVIAATFALAGGASLLGANYSVGVIEANSEYSVRQALDMNALTWAEVQADGLQVFVSGTAPTEAMRFHALTTAGTIVDASRVIDQMQIESTDSAIAPRFSIEILRNDSGISLIGLIPASTDREALTEQLGEMAGQKQVTDLLESADYPVADSWDLALAYSMRALYALPRAKISIDADRVAIIAISDSPEEKHALEQKLRNQQPPGVAVTLDIAAPRPVITPFTLRFVMDDDGARFDACSADTETARDRILTAARAAGLDGNGDCTIGLGVPSPNWGQAAERAIKTLGEIGGGTLTFSDADITLVGATRTNPAIFDNAVGELENALPEVFALHASLPETQDASKGPTEFIGTLSPEGLVQLRGRVSGELMRNAAQSLAQARFGADAVHMSARIDEKLPANWPIRVLTALEALSKLSNGAVTVTPDLISVSGKTGNPDASSEISRFLADKLGEGERFAIDVEYLKKLDPIAGIPKPEECEDEIKGILGARKINFEPGSATPDAESRGVIDDIAAVLDRCGELKMEIAGHTDSQGREGMNAQLSQDRANAVLTALRERRVLTGSLSAVGYGETRPIADNETEEGRETNRRIEFNLFRPAPTAPEPQTTLESVAQNGDVDAEQANDGADQGAATTEGQTE